MAVYKVFKNQGQELGPGFSKEFYDELHRFYSEGNRRSGRTYLLARVLVNTAIETGAIVNVTDHHLISDNRRHRILHMRREIEKVAHEYSQMGLDLHCEFIREDSFKVRIGLSGNIYRSTEKYIQIKNNYQPLSQPLTPEECFKPQNRKLLLIKI